VKFEDGFSISVLKNRATPYKNLQLEIVKSQKKKRTAANSAEFQITILGSEFFH
jgi:hypothetical protein